MFFADSVSIQAPIDVSDLENVSQPEELDETSWWPSEYHVMSHSTEETTGWVANEESLEKTLEAHRRATMCSFVSWLVCADKLFFME